MDCTNTRISRSVELHYFAANYDLLQIWIPRRFQHRYAVECVIEYCPTRGVANERAGCIPCLLVSKGGCHAHCVIIF